MSDPRSLAEAPAREVLAFDRVAGPPWREEAWSRPLWWSGPALAAAAVVAAIVILAFAIGLRAMTSGGAAVVALGALGLPVAVFLAALVWTVQGLPDLVDCLGCARRFGLGRTSWPTDLPWSESGATRGGGRRMLAWLGRHTWQKAGLILLVLLWSGMLGWHVRWILGAAVVAVVAWGMFRRAAAGGMRVTYMEPPYRPGEPLVVRFGLEDGASQLVRARFDLRVIQEVRRPAHWFLPGKGRHTVWWQSRYRLDPGRLPEGGADIELEFAPPAYLPGTDLVSRYRTYWELRMVGNAHLGPLTERFLIPVYAP